jgi:ABC-type antimicrobial peptide transport system permease subunit
VQQINVQTTSAATLDASVIAINKLLLQQHGGEADFHTLTGKEITAPMGQLFFVIAGVTTLIASISLFVGGIGIMNIMLVNVAERTREIGIRKALGATRGDILWQFLVEAIIMALLGGIIGGALGLTVAFIISLFLTFDPVITWQLAVVSIGVASGVGVLFGLYPALRAAHKHPIEALNQQS